MHSSTSGSTAWIVRRSLSRAARRSGFTDARYSLMVFGFARMVSAADAEEGELDRPGHLGGIGEACVRALFQGASDEGGELGRTGPLRHGPLERRGWHGHVLS